MFAKPKKMSDRLLYYGSASAPPSAAAGDASLLSADWLAFDLDHTLAKYRSAPLMSAIHDLLVHDLTSRAASAGGGYPASALPSSPLSVLDVQRGVLCDFRTGDALKLDERGAVSVAFHGARRLSAAEIAAKYGGEGRRWGGLRLVEDRQRHASVALLASFFEAPVLPIFRHLVDYADGLDAAAGGGGLSPPLPEDYGAADAPPLPPRYAKIRADLMDAINRTFENNKAAYSSAGSLCGAIAARPLDFLHPRPHLRRALVTIRRSRRQRIALITNSHTDFATVVLRATLGDDWRECFDAVVFNSQKPGFFDHGAPFHLPDFGAGVDGPVAQRTYLPLFDGASGAAAADAVDLASCGVTRGSATAMQAIADAAKEGSRASALLSELLGGIAAAAGGGGGKAAPRAGLHCVWAAAASAATASLSAAAGAAAPRPAGPPALAELFLEVEIEEEATEGVGGGVNSSSGGSGVDRAAAPAASTGIVESVASTSSFRRLISLSITASAAISDAAAAGPAPALPPAAETETAEAALAPPTPIASPKASFVYFGDHLFADFVASAAAGWTPVAVVEELECSGPRAHVPHAIVPVCRSAEARALVPPREATFGPDYDAKCIWGGFFDAAPVAEDEAAPGGGRRSYYCNLLQRHAQLGAAVVTDVDCLDFLFPFA